MIKKYSITKQGVEIAAADERQFGPSTEFQDIDSWKSFHVNENSWGLQERWVRPTNGPIPEGYTDTREVNVGSDELPSLVTEYFYPADYEVTVSDITSEVTASAKKAKREKSEAWGIEFRRWIQDLNEGAGITPAMVIALRQNEKIKMATELAESGEIPSLKVYVETTNWDGLFPAAVVQQALIKINAFLAENP